MKHMTKNAVSKTFSKTTTWVTLSVMLLASLAVFAVKKPTYKDKSTHIVVDRLINRLVCEFTRKSNNTKNFPRGILGSSLACTSKRSPKGSKTDYTLSQSRKREAGARIGQKRGEVRRPYKWDGHP